ncbi:hypothetical protein BU24DRAFT_23368 [Aaosphaeria arxii CBS 175.79]|uniref:Uncharacterized protein n=1 Tax=Aaosphaeria arxii CBS 175.79 TaxID=1450172 RepID=A0A6A5Y8P3_9PLEO|nr:uncharacterized protein BU24DRAFT_23368 [Aaosphaeria arxii CBS 175.79]KAF2021593.1 hypothetical protein BU24DRAFT_23368 [Aaosphaeria arxii CBS 175.79]
MTIFFWSSYRWAGNWILVRCIRRTRTEFWRNYHHLFCSIFKTGVWMRGRPEISLQYHSYLVYIALLFSLLSKAECEGKGGWGISNGCDIDVIRVWLHPLCTNGCTANVMHIIY